MVDKLILQDKLNRLRIAWTKETDATRRLVIEKQAKMLKMALKKIEDKGQDLVESAENLFGGKAI